MSDHDSKELLLNAAKIVFARRGYDGATVKELAEVAGVNVSLVSYYFQGKEGLYRACLERFGRDRLAVAERVLQPPRSIEDLEVRLRLFTEEFITCHLDNRELTAIIHREMNSEMEVTQDVFREVFVKILEAFKTFLKAAQKSGLILQETDIHVTALLYFGGLIHLSRVDPIQKQIYRFSLDDKKFRERVISNVTQNFLLGIRSHKK